MIITPAISDHIIKVASGYIGRPFDYEKFNCVHFVREVFGIVGITLPLLDRKDLPPIEFHLARKEFDCRPIGHSVFLKRKTSGSICPWSHVVIVFSESEVIHCPRRFGGKVVITSLPELFHIYDLAPSHSE